MAGIKTFIARQPIFDRHQNVFAYELLFRHAFDNSYDGSDPCRATSRVILDNLHMMDLDVLLGGKLAFVNATRESLIGDHMTLLPKDKIIIEIVETITPDAEVLAACTRLKKAGYRLALDDFCGQEEAVPFLEIADIIKVDFLDLEGDAPLELMKKHSRGELRFLAEKLETQEIYKRALECGYHFFQGYYFSRPAILTGRRIGGSRARYLELLQELSKSDIDFALMEDILRRDVSISYRILRYINSAFFGLRHKVCSLKQALLLLGATELKKWISVVALAALADDKPDELFVQSLVRARFCESIAHLAHSGDAASEAFLAGMFSMIDAMLDRTLPEILIELPIDDCIRNALMGQDNHLARILNCCVAYERGDWKRFEDLSKELGMDNSAASDLYVDAVGWGQDSLVSIKR